ncbi:MAG: peptidoglycan-associated lipoprotein Pal [Smithellaceae bacterium]|jgi:peptidoglycan-associated lipoprotein|nr:peptidoglycan-associated lipoprotein Pal [Smithellaceae bacterium]MDD3257842.1 peptidoglycan-associated lipoprotein Pal [Smithellaceae bacterium]MDD3847792.1 peptidoglycan-associated lipoprotein Pal [Smithellaceae bacterium]HOG11914.1 peptidoglycan-associated lipoprotein Pal [Smithellaceae bacterium]HOQ71679.1 peptidoglycan-associated lipoprotein Pal [Smithellaceae bacterium]
MNRHLTVIGLLLIFVFSLTIFSGCAEKQAVVKDEAMQEQKVAAAQEGAPAPVAADDDAALRAKEAADREAALKEQAAKDEAARKAAARAAWAKKNAEALVDLNIQNIYFDYDKSGIRPDAREILKANAEIFTKNSAAKIIVEGHCDERGTAEYNMALGERRAQEAKQYLVNLGIDASRIETISYGKERPLDNRSIDEAWAQNRRAQFLLK